MVGSPQSTAAKSWGIGERKKETEDRMENAVMIENDFLRISAKICVLIIGGWGEVGKRGLYNTIGRKKMPYVKGARIQNKNLVVKKERDIHITVYFITSA